MELTCGERLVRCLTGDPIDRVPYGVGLGWYPWPETLNRWRAESGRHDLEVQHALGLDDGFALPALHSGIYPAFEAAVLEETAEFIVFRDERGITMRGRRDGGSIPEWLDYPVKTESDWLHLKEERLRLDSPGRVPEDWDAFRARLRATGEAVQVGVFPYGVFGTARDLLGAEELLISFYTRPELVRDIMEHLTSLWLSLWEQVAAEVQIDHIHIWEDMSGKQGPLISPKMVRDFMMPQYDRIADFARSAGVRVVSVDTDGDCSQLVPIMIEHGVNMFLPFEVQAGNDILLYREHYPDLGIMFGLDKRALAGTREQIDAEVERAAHMLRRGRYVPGFDHSIPPDVPWANYRYAAEALRTECYRAGALA